MDQLTLLALDTATEHCSVSLLVKGQRFVRAEKVGNGHSQLILPWIDEVLKEAGIALRDVDGILFGAGPGAFTGLRIACGVAQGLAFGADKKLLPVCNLEALAHHAFEKAARVAVMNDARMGECYAAVYEKTADGVVTVAQPMLIKPEGVAEWLAAHGAQYATGTGIEAYKMALAIDNAPSHLEADAMIDWYLANREALKDAWVAPELAAPIYVRDRVALTIEERAQGKRL